MKVASLKSAAIGTCLGIVYLASGTSSGAEVLRSVGDQVRLVATDLGADEPEKRIRGARQLYLLAKQARCDSACVGQLKEGLAGEMEGSVLAELIFLMAWLGEEIPAEALGERPVCAEEIVLRSLLFYCGLLDQRGLSARGSVCAYVAGCSPDAVQELGLWGEFGSSEEVASAETKAAWFEQGARRARLQLRNGDVWGLARQLQVLSIAFPAETLSLLSRFDTLDSPSFQLVRDEIWGVVGDQALKGVADSCSGGTRGCLSAIRVLVRVGARGPSATAVLAERLNADVKDVRLAAANALGSLGADVTPEALGGLMSLVSSTDADLRRAAALAVVAIDPRRLDAVLAEIGDSDAELVVELQVERLGMML